MVAPAPSFWMGAHRGQEDIKGQVEGAQMHGSPAPGLGDEIFLARYLGSQRTETMLLWLTLTTLWSTVCWAEQMYGNGNGWYFSSPTDSGNIITGIRVSINFIGIFKSIQVRYGPTWSETYGISGGHSQEFILWPGEQITGLYGSHRIYIRYLVVYTNFGRWASFGSEGGQSFVAYPDKFGKVLTGVFGQYYILGITGVGFKWDYPLESVTLPATT
ncbi:pancreatic adenocarcinoma up-regulated factor-like [Saccopteryx bilineata]|uniref:pancreatic adenocarcinoma up-regulated factor-like n=1 Tax=Saccopteryx bilineata TaxID=59482 RepID=UPI00338DAAE2